MKNEFAVHLLNDTGLTKATAVAEAFSKLLETLDDLDIDGLDRAIVVTKLQEACFFAKRCVASNPLNQMPKAPQ